MNTYGYVGGNPVNSIDPSGLICGSGACAAIAAIIIRATTSSVAKKAAGNAVIGGFAGGSGAFISSGGDLNATVDGALIGTATAFNPISGKLGLFTSGLGGNLIGQGVVLDRNCQDLLEPSNYDPINASVSGVGSLVGGGLTSYLMRTDRSASAFIINRGLGAGSSSVQSTSTGLFEGTSSGAFEGIFGKSNVIKNKCGCSR